MTSESKKNSEEKVKAILSDALKDMSEEECFGWKEEPSITVEELELLAEQAKKRRRNRFFKYAGIAAAAVLVCIVTAAVLWPDSEPAMADKDHDKVVEQDDDVVVIKEKEDSSIDDSEAGVIVREVTNWKEVKNQRKFVSGLCIPTWIPEKYKFQKLEIEKNTDKKYSCDYMYADVSKKNFLFILQKVAPAEEKTEFMEKYDKKINSKKGNIYMSKYSKGELITGGIIYNNSVLIIQGDLSEKEVIKIINKLDI